jgi:hypothetical protein
MSGGERRQSTQQRRRHREAKRLAVSAGWNFDALPTVAFANYREQRINQMHFKGWTTDVRLSAVGGVLLIIALIIYGARTFQKPEDLPNWLPWVFWASWIGGFSFNLAGAIMRAHAARARR